MWNALPTLALDFASPWLLWGTALGAIPVIIHLLHKRRHHEIPWAAMRFLLEAARKNSRRIRIEQLLLLAVRVLILVFLAVALARPFVETFGQSILPGEAPLQRIIVVDASFSMGFQQGEQNRFEQAKTVARQIVSAARTGDALNMLRISGLPPRSIVHRPSYQKGEVLDEMDRLKLTHERGALLPTLEQLESLLQETSGVERKEIYLISDFQRNTWFPESAALRSQLRETFQRISEHARLVAIDVADSHASNLAVTGFRSKEALATVGQPVRLQADVQNFGRSLPSQRAVELYVDGQLVETREFSIPAGSQASVEAAHTFTSEGEHQLEIRLNDDGLAIDNRRFLSFPTRGELQVLLVNGRPSGQPSETATHYLETALSPARPARYQRETDFVRVRVISEGELLGEDLSRYDCVFICDVALFTRPEARLLRGYARSGGGLVFCLGDRVQPNSYNRLLYGEGDSLLPAQLIERVGNATAPREAFEFDRAELKHPLVEAFEGRPGTGLERTLTFEYFRVAAAVDGQARVALQFRSGDPAIVEAPFGQGRVILFTTALDSTWGTWPLQESFLPIVHEAVRFAVSGRLGQRQRLVGQPLDRAIPGRATGVPATVILPDGSQAAVQATATDGDAILSYQPTTSAGFYALKLGPPRNRMEMYAVNVDTSESDLTKIEAKELQSGLLAGLDVDFRTDWRDLRAEADSGNTAAQGIAGWLLLATLCLLLVEQLMAYHFFYGFVLLYVFVSVTLVEQTIASHLVGAIVLAVVLLAGLLLMLRVRKGRDRQRSPAVGSR